MKMKKVQTGMKRPREEGSTSTAAGPSLTALERKLARRSRPRGEFGELAEELKKGKPSLYGL